MESNAKRGFVPKDARFFSADALPLLRTAARHIRFLINEGYDIKSASTYVGNHFLLSERQRLALVRSLATDRQLAGRRRRECTTADLHGRTAHVDGFNTIITLETALCDSPLFRGMDGAIRDLAGLRGSYRLIAETSAAIRLLLDRLQRAEVRKAVIYLDAPVSNSGRLKQRIAELYEAKSPAMGLDLQVLRDVDRTLMRQECVVTADAMILDQCRSWYNLTARCLPDCGAEPLVLYEAAEAENANKEAAD
ncbi:MAG: DUF434 domain-containing protein [Anaerovoracaceae bacterium]|jgi:hypothetical protein